jgi:hypothetical protein
MNRNKVRLAVEKIRAASPVSSRDSSPTPIPSSSNTYLRNQNRTPKPTTTYNVDPTSRPTYRVTTTPIPSPEPTRSSRYDPGQSSEEISDSDVYGSGIVVIPSKINDIIKRHQILLGSFNSGNTGVFNELQAITHELFKHKLLNENDVKKRSSFI